MNPKAQQFRVKPCIVCGFPFSDDHHVYPQALGGNLFPTVRLCPNHHRFANIIQSLAQAGASPAEVQAFGDEHFDESFRAHARPNLINLLGICHRKVLSAFAEEDA